MATRATRMTTSPEFAIEAALAAQRFLLFSAHRASRASTIAIVRPLFNRFFR
jgi:hypothetical protein